MSGRVLKLERAVARRGNDAARGIDDHRADGHLAPQAGGLSLGKGEIHEGWGGFWRFCHGRTVPARPNLVKTRLPAHARA